eukprot:948915-Rhodomonas_salina.1
MDASTWPSQAVRLSELWQLMRSRPRADQEPTTAPTIWHTRSRGAEKDSQCGVSGEWRASGTGLGVAIGPADCCGETLWVHRTPCQPRASHSSRRVSAERTNLQHVQRLQGILLDLRGARDAHPQ